MEKHLIEKYSKPVPRYTSYPTAPHFHDGITADDYKIWLENLDKGQPGSLYIHIPFCNELCWFCGCHTKITRQYKPVEKYVSLLIREIKLVAAALREPLDISHIHWGGGSPTLLSADDFTRISRVIARHFNILPDAEIAVEIDPRTLKKPLIDAFRIAGVTRASIGVQDFNPTVQDAINRHQPYELVARVVTELRDAGIEAINFDLIYGLPHQTVASVRETANQTIGLSPDRLSVFGYAHVPWMKSHMRMINSEDLPDIMARFHQANAIAETLQKVGYRHIGLDHFAKPDDELAQAVDKGQVRRNFQGYTTDLASALIGFGVSAIGNTPSGYVQNHSSMRQYTAAIEDGSFAISKGVATSEADHIQRKIIETLMCDFAVDIKLATSAFPLPRPLLAPLQQDGLIEITADELRITAKGRPFVRTVCAAFDQYLHNSEARHSVAV